MEGEWAGHDRRGKRGVRTERVSGVRWVGGRVDWAVYCAWRRRRRQLRAQALTMLFPLLSLLLSRTHTHLRRSSIGSVCPSRTSPTGAQPLSPRTGGSSLSPSSSQIPSPSPIHAQFSSQSSPIQLSARIGAPMPLQPPHTSPSYNPPTNGYTYPSPGGYVPQRPAPTPPADSHVVPESESHARPGGRRASVVGAARSSYAPGSRPYAPSYLPSRAPPTMRVEGSWEMVDEPLQPPRRPAPPPLTNSLRDLAEALPSTH